MNYSAKLQLKGNVPSKLCACACAHRLWDERTQETLERT